MCHFQFPQVKGESEMQMQHLENWQALGSFLPSYYCYGGPTRVLHSNTKEHAFSQSVFCLFFGGISRYIDILTEKFREVFCSILSEKIDFGMFGQTFLLQHVLLSHFCYALVIRVCFREISLIGTCQLKPVLTSGNLGYKT